MAHPDTKAAAMTTAHTNGSAATPESPADAGLAWRVGASRYDWLPAYGNWYLGESLRRLGALDQAEEALGKVVTAVPDGRFVPEAHVALAETALARGSSGAAAARRHYEKLQELGKSGDLPERYEHLAALGLATIDARFGSASRGIDRLKVVLQETDGRDARVANLARLEIGRTYVRQKRFDEAQAYFERIQDQIDKADPNPVLIAGAANGLADSQFQQGEFDDAALTYSKVYALFYDRPDLRDDVAHALFQGGLAFDRLAGDRERSEEQRSVFRRRARILWNRAFSEFKGTRGAALAKRELGR